MNKFVAEGSSEKKPRVLMVVNDARFLVTHRLDLVLGLRDGGYNVEVAAPAIGRAADVIREAGVTLHHVPIERQGVNPINEIRAVLALVELYTRLRPEIVHHVTVKPILYGSFAARLTRVPAVVNAISGLGILFAQDGFMSSVRSLAVRTAYRVAMSHPNVRTIFQTAHDRSTFLRAKIVSEDQALLIPGSGVVLSSFRPDVPPENPPIVMLPARLLRRKGIREFVEAARILKAQGSNARFVLVGDQADNRDAIPASELNAWKNEGVVELWGWVDDMPSAISRSAIVCLPSYSEGVPKALVDAGAAGRPAVTTDTPGCNDVIIDGLNGLLVAPREIFSLADALQTLLVDSELRGRMGRKARELAERRFDVRFILDKTLRTYHSLRTYQSLEAAP